MANMTNLGASLGALLAGSVDPTGRLSGELAGGRQVQALSTADYNRARMEESLIDAALKKQRLDFDPYEATRMQMGITPSIGAQLREYATNPEFVAPEGFDADLAKNFMRNASSYLYGNTMGESNPLNIGKGQAQFMENDFMGGQGDPLEYARRAAALKGDGKGIVETDALSAVQGGGLSPEMLGNQIKALTLAAGKPLYDFRTEGVGDVVTGNFDMNDIGKAKVGSERALAGQRNAAANLNNANIGLVNAKTVNERNKPAAGSAADKPPAGYRWTQDGGLEVIPGGPQDKTGKTSLNSRQVAGATMQRQAVVNLVAAQTGTSVQDVNKILDTEGPDGVAKLMLEKGGRFSQGPILGRTPLGWLQNQDVEPYTEQIARGQAMINDPAGPITSADVDGARAMSPSRKMSIDVQANLVKNLLRGSTEALGLETPAPSNQRQVDSIPDPATLPEGARLTDPESGNAMIVRGGKWVKDSRRQ